MLAATNAHAAKVCGGPPPIALEKSIAVPSDVNFFLRSSPATAQVGLATAAGNRLLDVKSGEFREVPGLIDPVLSPDGAILTTPETWVYNPRTKRLLTSDQARKLGVPGHEAFGVRFQLLAGRATEWIDPVHGKARQTDYTEEELRKKGLPFAAQYMSFYRLAGGEWKLVAQDKDSQVVYQSVGVLGPRRYRLLVEGDGGLYTRDYELSEKGDEVRFGPPARAVCGGYHGTLPVIDKSGIEFASFDPEARATKVIDIGASGEKCDVKESLPVFVGKADFSPSRRRLVFHSLVGPAAGVPMVPGRAKRLGVYVYDRDARALAAVPGPIGEDNYYPVFLDDDRIAFLSATLPDKRGRQKFHVNVASLAALPLSLCPDCYDGGKRDGQLAALLGLVSIRSCHRGARAAFPEAMGAFGLLTKESCAELAGSCGKSCLRGALAATGLRPPKPGKGHFAVWDGGRGHESWDRTLLGDVAPADLAALCREL